MSPSSPSSPPRKVSKTDLTQGSIGPLLIRLTAPMVWGMFAIISFNVVDTYYVGQLGSLPLAALGFTFPLSMVLISIASGLGHGASSVISRAIGEGDDEQVRILTTDCLILAFLVVNVAGFTGLMTIDPMFRLLGASDETLPLIREYITIWYWGLGLLIIPMVGNNAIRAGGDTRFPSMIMTVAAITNLILDPLLIFGIGPFPEFGLAGAAWASLCGRALTLIAGVYVLHFKKAMLTWSMPTPQRLVSSWRRILHVGLPAVGTNLIVPLSSAILTAMVAQYGPEAVAGYGVATRIEAFALLVFMALSTVLAGFVGQNTGKGLIHRVRAGLFLTFQFAMVWGISLAALLFLFREPLAGVFNPDPRVMAVTALYLAIVPWSYGADGIRMTVSSAFNAMGTPMPTVLINVVRMLVLYVPLAWLGSVWFGIEGIFTAGVLAQLIAGAGAGFWFHWQTQHRPEVQAERQQNVEPHEKTTGA